MKAAYFRIWIGLVFVITIVLGSTYLAIQQDIRAGANDPQIQLAEDGALALSGGADSQSIVSQNSIDIAKSLAPFTIVYDESGLVKASSALINGQTPQLPEGVFLSARQKGENRFTWQPSPGIRLAAVIVHFDGPNPGFVLVGRSLREVEIREDNELHIVFLGWLIAVAGSFASLFFLRNFTRLARRSKS